MKYIITFLLTTISAFALDACPPDRITKSNQERVEALAAGIQIANKRLEDMEPIKSGPNTATEKVRNILRTQITNMRKNLDVLCGD